MPPFPPLPVPHFYQRSRYTNECRKLNKPSPNTKGRPFSRHDATVHIYTLCCNLLLSDVTSERMARLQEIAYRTKLPDWWSSVTKRNERLTALLKKLHRLSVAERIFFKLATFSLRYLDGTLPSSGLVLTPSRSLRSSSQKPPTVPQVSLKSAGARCFQCQAPVLWNSLPLNTCLSSSLLSFKAQLKTHLSCTAVCRIYLSAFEER